MSVSNPNEDYEKLVAAATCKHRSEAMLMNEQARKVRAEVQLTEQQTKAAGAENIRRSLASKYAFGKDCASEEICHPYSVAIKELLWGFSLDEEISPDTTRKYENASSQALYNVNRDQVMFLYKPPVVPNLSSGLPLPYSVQATNTVLSATSQPYWFWPYIEDPNPGKVKHGRATWECRDLMNEVITTKTVAFKENQAIDFTCNDVATKFATAVKKEKKTKKGFF